MHHGSKPQFAVGSLSVSLFTVQASPHRGPVLPITTNAPLATSWGFTRTPSSRRTGAVVNVTTPLTNGRWMVCLIYMQIPHRPHYTPAPPLERCPLPSTLHSAWQARSHWGCCARQPLRTVGSWSLAVHWSCIWRFLPNMSPTKYHLNRRQFHAVVPCRSNNEGWVGEREEAL